MTFGLFRALLPLLFVGPALVWIFSPRNAGRPLSLDLILGFGAGIGFLSLFAFGWVQLTGSFDQNLFLAEWIVAFLLLGLTLAKYWKDLRKPGFIARRHVALVFVFLIGLILLLIAPWFYPASQQYGGYDGVVIWNMRARFLFLGGDNWRAGFTPLVNWKLHPDYPLLLPLAVAHLWLAVGNTLSRLSSFVALVFGVGLLGLLFAGLAQKRSIWVAVLGSFILLGSPLWFDSVIGQTADLPIAFFFLATCIALEMAIVTGQRNYLILAGYFAGLAAWTKNEGLWFVCVVVVVYLVLEWRRTPARRISFGWLALLGGIGLPLAALIFFKLRLAPPSDLFQTISLHVLLQKLLDPGRYVLIGRYLGKALLFPGLQRIPVLVVLCGLLLLGRRVESSESQEAQNALIWISILTLVGYCGIYLVSPHPLAWHLKTSVDRLILQLLPIWLYILLGRLPDPENIFLLWRADRKAA